MTSVRRSDFDVTNSVQVSSPRAVLRAVEVLYRPTWPGLSMEPLARAFEHFERLFAGRVPGYHGVDTVYHDRQHTRSEEHTSELQSRGHLVCRLLLEKKKKLSHLRPPQRHPAPLLC